MIAHYSSLRPGKIKRPLMRPLKCLARCASHTCAQICSYSNCASLVFIYKFWWGHRDWLRRPWAIAWRRPALFHLCPAVQTPSSGSSSLRPGKIKRPLMRPLNFSGGDTGTRTLDPMIKSHLLYQLSYVPKNGT